MKPVISKDLILINPKVRGNGQDQVIRDLCTRLEEGGYVDSDYYQQVLEREEKFPTGLPTLPYPIAIPHGENHSVLNTGVALAVLNEPVPFRAMDTPEEFLDVKLVFLLAVADPKKQVTLLRWVSEGVQDQALLRSLGNATSSVEALRIIKPLINNHK